MPHGWRGQAPTVPEAPRIEIEGLNVWFGEGAERSDAVIDADIHVSEGESFGLVGESGSGKSTVLRTAMGLSANWTGRIRVADCDARTGDRATFLKTTQMVFQDPYASLHPRYVVGEAIAEPMRINKIKNTEQRTAELLEAIGLNAGHRFRYPHELSGGQRQRVAIARALALNPKVLLLDEPTSALDVSIQAEVLNLLNRLKQQLGLTFLIVSHDLAVVSYMCERLAVMKAGRIVEVLDRKTLRSGQAKEQYTRDLIAAS